ncbi:retrovirus-related pol polyprotein from transposon TNT 1-94 [Tanacetum coccineum]
MTPSHFNTYQSSYNNPKFQQQFSPSQSPQYGSIHPTQHYSTTYPSTPLATTYLSAPYVNAYLSTVHQDAYPQPQSITQIEYTVSIVNQQTHLAEFPQIDSGLAVLVFKQGDDPIDAINKMMSFRGRSHGKTVPKAKEERDATLFRDKVLLVEAQGSGKVLSEEELDFLADLGVAEGPVTPMVITHNAAYQADDLDAYDYDCDDISTAKAVLMANLSSYRSYVLFEVPHSENNHNDILNQSMQEMSYSKQTHLVNYPENEITSDSNIIPYSHYLLETQNAAIQDTSSFAKKDAMILSVFEQLSNQVTNCNKVNKDNLIANESLSVEEKETLKTTFNVLKNESKEKEAKNIDKEIALEKKVKELGNIVYKMALGLQNPFYLKKGQQIRPMLYDGTAIAKETNVISIADSEETLMFEEEIRSKMLLKQSDPMVLEKKVNIKPFNYAELNRLSEDFGKRFVPHQKLSDEQDFWLQTSHPNTDQSASLPVKIKDPRELPKISMVNTSLKKLKYHLGQFDTVVKKHITPDALTEGEWGWKLLFNNMNTTVNVNSSVILNDSVNYVEKCNKCLELEVEFIKPHNMVEKDEYNKVLKKFSKLEQHCISLELAMQINKEIFQKNNTYVVQIVLWYLDSGCSKRMTGDRSQLTNFVQKFLGTVKFGLGHNLFSVGQFCDSDLEVAFRKHTCFVRNLEGVDLLSGSRETNLYTLLIGDMMASSPICLLSKASKTKSCKKQSHKPKSEDTDQEKLYRLYIDLYGPMRVTSVNGKKYILFIVDDYSRFTWMKFLALKDEVPDFIIKFLKMIQVRLNATVRNIHTDNGTEFVNQTMRYYYESVGISHETSVARSPQQNGVVERRNRTLVEAARTMLIYARTPLFLRA